MIALWQNASICFMGSSARISALLIAPFYPSRPATANINTRTARLAPLRPDKTGFLTPGEYASPRNDETE